MNTNDTNPHTATSDRRSAAPSPVDTRGQRQRTKQYINAHQSEIERIRRENPETVRHKNYSNSYQHKRRRNSLFILVLSIFLFFSLSLFTVYGVATMLKDKAEPADTTISVSDTVFTTDSPQTDTQAPETTADTTEQKPIVRPVYAQLTDNTKNLGDNIVSTNAILIELDTHTITAQKNAGQRIFPASMTKIMTLLVAAENMTSLKQSATVTKQTTNYCYVEGASVVGFSPDETVTMEDLLYGTILPSGADATMTLAECIAGSEDEFVKLMNQKAIDLGLTGTHFVNTSGLHHPDHYSTVHDIALILKAAMDNDICFKVLTASHYVTSETTQHTTGIPLYSIVHQRIAFIKLNTVEIIGGKTGYTPEAGQCLATFAITQDGREFIFVSANSPAGDKLQPARDAQYAYKSFTAIPDSSDTTAAA